MKLSFSLSSKPKPNQKASIPSTSDEHEDQSRKEFVTEFDSSKTLAEVPSFVIPPKPTEWRPYKKMKNLDLPLQSNGSRDLQFELHPDVSVSQSDAQVSYGLNLRSKSDVDDKQAISQYAPVEAVLLQSLKEDLKNLPDDQGFKEFEDVPVEGFGKALLAGYGWVEGRGIGKNAKEDVKVKQYDRRTDKEGLGFSSKEIKERLPTFKDRPVKGKREEDDHGFSVGKDVRVIEGRTMGSKGKILEKLGGGWVVLKLKNSEEEVKVRGVEIAHLGSIEEENCLRKLKELKIREVKDLKYTLDERKGSKRSRGSEKRINAERNRSNGGDRGLSWLRSHIRVRIISKDLQGGKLYLKKGQVVDVVGPYTCDISMDETRELIQGVDQELLETALPSRGGPVLVLYGRHKGVYGTLEERDLDRETGVVRDADGHELVNVKLEQIAEYTGDPAYLGY